LNTYLTVISRATEMRFVCTLPATSCCTHLSLNPVLCRVCAYSFHSPDHCTWAAADASLDRDIWSRYNCAGGKHSARSVDRWPFCQYCYEFNFNMKTCCI